MALIKQARAEHHGDDQRQLHHAPGTPSSGVLDPTGGHPARPVAMKPRRTGCLAEAARFSSWARAETLDRLLGRTGAEPGAAKARSNWSLFSVLRPAHQARTSDTDRQGSAQGGCISSSGRRLWEPYGSHAGLRSGTVRDHRKGLRWPCTFVACCARVRRCRFRASGRNG